MIHWLLYIRNDAHNETLYVVGTREGLNRYRSRDDLGKVDKNQDIVVFECITIIKESEIEVLLTHLLQSPKLFVISDCFFCRYE